MANDVKIVLTAQDKASEGVDRVAGRIEALEKASSAVAERMDTIRNALAGVVTVGAGLALSKQFIDMADSMALLQSRVKLATSGAAEFAQVQADLFALAQRNSVSLEEVAGAFSRLSDPVKRLGGGSKEAIGIIEALSKSLKISGASAQESAAAIQQFGQAMGSGKLQGDEFKSLAEAAPRFMKALSEGSGIAAEKLKDMASEGKLTADVVGNALLNSLDKLNSEAAQMPDTVGQAMTRLKNEVAKAVDEINQAGGINTALAGMVGDTAALIAPIKQEMIEAFQAVGSWIENNREGLAQTGQAVGGVVSDVWRMAESMASVVGFAAEVSTKAGLLKTVLESVRIILAGIEDGITIIGAAFVKVGADIVDILYKPLGNLMLAYGNALEMIGSSSARWWQEAGDKIRNTTNAAHEYADGVHTAFANNESALGRLNTQLAATAAAQSKAGSAAATAGVALAEQGKTAAKTAAAFASLRASLKGDADKGNADKGKSGPDPYQSLLEGLRRQLATTEKLSAVEKLNLDLQDKKYAKIGALQKAELQAVAAQIDAQQRLAAVRKLDDADEAARVAWTKRHGQSLAEEEQAIWNKVEAQVQATRVMGLSAAATEELTLADMQQQLAWRESLGLNDDVTESLKRRIAAQKQLIAETQNGEIKQAGIDAAKAAADAHKKAAEEAARAWQKTVDTIDGTFHDAFTDMLKQGKADWDAFGKALATSFKSAVADEIYKMTIRPIVVSVVSSFAGGAAQAAGAATGQTGSGIGGVISGVQSVYGAVNGGIANAATAFATSGMGQYLGLSSTAPIATGTEIGSVQLAGAAGSTTGGAYLTGSGSTLSAVAAPATAALIGTYLMAEMAKAGWGMDNNRSAGGAYASNPYLYTAYQAGSRLFGHNRNISTDAGGIQGVFDASGFTGDRWQQFSQRGGTFRSDKRGTATFELDSDIDSYLDSLMRQTVSQLQAIGKTLDVETVRAVEGFSHQFSLQLSENGSWEKAGEKIAGEMAKVSDELVKSLVPGLADLSLFGETATQTFTRLGQEVAATDAILLAMGKNAAEAFGGVGLASIAAREHLIDLAGGLESLASKTQSFYANFYSPEEQLQLAGKQAQKVLTEGFAELGQSIPATREAFRSLVESQDLSSEAGRKLWNSLLDLQDEFDTVADGADATAASMQAAADKLAAATATAKQRQASLFDTFASDAQKLAAAQSIVNNTFASIGRQVPENASAFLQLAQSIDPATESGRALISALDSVSDAFAYVQTASAAAAAAAHQQSIDAMKGQADALQGQADATASAIEALAAGMGSLSPAVETLADKLTGIRDRLAASYSKDFASGLAGLNQSVGWRDQLSGARGNLADALFDAKLRLPGADVVGMLRGRESDLWSQMATATDKGQIAGLLQQTLMQRIQAEADVQKAAAQDQATRLQSLHEQAVSTLSLQQDQVATQKTALQQQIGAWQKMLDVSQRLRDTVAGMAVDDLSSLNPFEQLASARQSFDQALAAARGGDTEAAGRLGQLGQAYRQEGRDVYASSAAYARIDSSVRAALESVAGMMDKSGQLSDAEQQVKAIESQAATLASQLKTLNDSYTLQQQQAEAEVNTAAREIELLSKLNGALSQSQTGVQALIDSQLAGLQRLADAMQQDGLSEALTQQLQSLPDEFAVRFVNYTQPDESRDLLRQQLAATKQQLDDERARYNGLVAMHKEQMEQLQDMNAKLRAIESNATLARAGA